MQENKILFIKGISFIVLAILGPLYSLCESLFWRVSYGHQLKNWYSMEVATDFSRNGGIGLALVFILSASTALIMLTKWNKVLILGSLFLVVNFSIISELFRSREGFETIGAVISFSALLLVAAFLGFILKKLPLVAVLVITIVATGFTLVNIYSIYPKGLNLFF